MSEEKNDSLIIVESPTKAKTIKKFLPSNCTVIASMGHIRELDPSWDAVDVDNGFKPKYVIPDDKKKVVKEMKSLLSKADLLYLATDEDREGESISWHLLEVLKPKVPYKRMVFHEITKSAILKGFESGRDLDMDMVEAQETRRIVDRLFGYDISSIVQKKLSKKTLSAGRVQSPGLMLAVDREKERIAFRKTVYFDARAVFENGDGSTFDSRLVSYKGQKLAGSKSFDSITGEFSGKALLLNEEEADAIVDELRKGTFVITEVTSKPSRVRPRAPFITSTLQQDAIRKLHFSSKETMSVAQKLYENGFITYMRTDSPALSHEGLNAAISCVQNMYGKEYLASSPRIFKASDKDAQEAHEAIRPAGDRFILPSESGLTGKEYKLYDLIFKRTIACQMSDAIKNTTTARIETENAEFTSSGTQIEFAGFLKAYWDDDDESSRLPVLNVGEPLRLDDLSASRHETTPPARYTEATLIQELEKRGIGRPSTYATILDTLQNRKYLVKENGSLVPTFTAFSVSQFLQRRFPIYLDYEFTRKMESGLDEIANEKLDKLTYLNEFYNGENGLRVQVEKEKANDDKTEAKTLVLSNIDPRYIIKIGPYGAYILDEDEEGKPVYINIPDTYYPGNITNEIIQDLIDSKKDIKDDEPQSIGKTSDGHDIYVKTGRFGPYWETSDKKRCSIPKYVADAEMQGDAECANRYLSLPRNLGKDENGNDIIAAKGRYGAFVSDGTKFANLNKRDNDRHLFSVTLEEALDLLSGAKETKSKGAARKSTRKTAAPAGARELGELEGEKVSVAHGRYGWYLKCGKDNFVIPAKIKNDEEAVANLTLDAAIEIINRKRAAKK